MATLQLERSSHSSYKWIVLILATLTQTSISYAGQGVAALAPLLQSSFHLSNAQVGITVGANNLGIGITALVFGGLVDRFGDKRVMVVGGLMTGVTILIATHASSFGVLLALLIVTGMWAGAATPSGSKAIFSYFVPTMRGMAMGIRQMGVAAGGFAAALTLPLIAKGSSWERALAFAGVMTLLMNIGYWIFYKSRHRPSTQSRVSRPGISRVLSNRSVWYVSIAATTLVGAQFVVLSYAQLFLHAKAGISFRYTFYFLAIAQLAGMSGRVVLGIVSDRFFASKRKPILLLASGAIIVLSLLMLLVGSSTPWWVIGLLLAFFGFVAMGWNGLWVTLVSELVDAPQSSTAIGLAMTVLQLGVLVFPTLFGVILDRWHSYDLGWIFTACAVFGGLILFTRVPER